MGSIMSGLYVGLSGLRTSSNSLNTTSNNLTNVNTDGYVRQQVVNRDVMYNFVNTTSGVNKGQSGLGVTVQTINHVRDIFLDAAYRKESGREQFYDKLYDSVYEIETQMGNVEGIEGIGYQEALTSFKESLNKLTEAPGDLVVRAAVAQSAVEFVDKAQLIYKGLRNYQNTLNDEVYKKIDRINEIGDQIQDLNKRISRIEAAGVENAADLRDSRDLLLDELASYCKISYSEDERGVVEVSVEGVPFADDVWVNHMGYTAIEGSDFIEAVWPDLNGQKVYNLNSTISTDTNTDIGGLKGLLIARGTLSPTSGDMTEPDPADYADGENDQDYIMALKRHNLYEQCKDTSVVANTMANFDKLVSKVMTAVNDILCPEKQITASDGTVYTVLDTDLASKGKDGTYGTELFKRDYTDRYITQTIDGETYYVRNNTNSYGNYSIYSINNISVNQEILKDYSKMPLTMADGSDDYDRANQLVNIFSKDQLFYNDGLDGLTFEEFFETLINDVATTGKIYKSMSENENALSANLDSRRQEIMGVSSDEELGNMIKYQQAYNAASRYINVVSEMMDTLINRLGA